MGRRLDGLWSSVSVSARTILGWWALAAVMVLLMSGAAHGGDQQTALDNQITLSLPGGVPLVMVWVPPGTFMMGSPEDEQGREIEEGPQHQVTLTHGFYMGRFEVTQAQWHAVMGSDPSTGDGIGPIYPVNQVSVDDIVSGDSFLVRLNQYLEATGQLAGEQLRLPTEAEWEYAARAGTATRFSFGDALECDDSCDECGLLDSHAVWCGNSSGSSAPVGSKLPNGFGLYDMHGNLWEWTATWAGPYPDTPEVDPTGPGSGEYKIARGGYFGAQAERLRSAARWSFHHTDCRTGNAGFRVVMTAAGEPPPTFDLAIPAVARIHGSGAFFTSRLELLNTGAQTARVEVQYTPRQDIGGESRTVTVTVPAGVLVEVEDPLGTWFGFTDAEPAVGGLLLTVVQGSPDALMAQSTVLAELDDGKEYGQLLPAQPASAALFAGRTAHIATTDDPSHNRVNCGVMALEDGTDVTVTAVDPMGTALAAGHRFRLDRGESAQLSDVHTRMGLGSAADFLLEVRVDEGSALAYGSVLDGVGAGSAYPGTSDPTTVLPVVNGSSRVTLLVLGSTQGYDEFSGSGCITNHSQSAATVQAQLFERGAPGVRASATLTVEAGRSVGFRDLVGSVFGVYGVVGTVVLTSSDDALLSAVGREFSIFRDTAGEMTGTAGQLMAGMDDGALLQPHETYHVLGVRQKVWATGLERSHLAAFNPGPSAVTLTVEAFDAATGVSEGTIHLTVPGEELVQRSNILAAINPSQDGRVKRLQVTVSGPLFVKAFRVNGNGDPVTLDPIRAAATP